MDADDSNQPFTQHMQRLCQTQPAVPVDENTVTHVTDASAEGLDDEAYAIAAALGLIEVPPVTLPSNVSTVVICEPVAQALGAGQATSGELSTMSEQVTVAGPATVSGQTTVAGPATVDEQAARMLQTQPPHTTAEGPLSASGAIPTEAMGRPAPEAPQTGMTPVPQNTLTPDPQGSPAPIPQGLQSPETLQQAGPVAATASPVAAASDSEGEPPSDAMTPDAMPAVDDDATDAVEDTNPLASSPTTQQPASAPAEAGIPAEAATPAPSTRTEPVRAASNTQDPAFMPVSDSNSESADTESGMSDGSGNDKQQTPNEPSKPALTFTGATSAREIAPDATSLQAPPPIASAPAPTAISPTSTMPTAERMQPADLLERFDRIVLGAMRSTDNSMRIELEPAALGRVTVNCRSTADGLSVEIGVLGSGVRDLLAGQESDLRSSLAAQGFQLGQFSVSCQDREGNHQSQAQRWEEPERLLQPRSAQKQQNATIEANTVRFSAGVRNRWVA